MKMAQSKLPTVAKALGFGLLVSLALTSCNQKPYGTFAGVGPNAQRAKLTPMMPGDDLNEYESQPKRQAIFDPATNALVNTGPQRVAMAEVTPKGDVTLNFVNADIKNVLQAVMGDILELNYVVNTGVQGTITVQTSQPLRREDVLPTLERVLNANGFSMVMTDGVYQIVPAANAAGAGSGPVVGPGSGGRVTAGLQTMIVPLRYASAGQVIKVLEPFVPPGGTVQADTSRNVFLVSGSGSQVQSIMRLIGVFDVDSLAGTSFALFPLEQGTPTTVAKELAAILETGPNGPLAGVVRVVPLDRIGSILVASTQPSYMSRIQTWIERLDKGWDETTPRLYVYHVQNSRAADVAKVMEGMFTDGSVQTVKPETIPGSAMTELGGVPSASPAVGVSRSSLAPPSGTASGTVLDSGTPGTTVTPRASGSGSPVAPSVSTPTSSGLASAGGTGGGGGGPGPRIVADEKNNALVIFAQPRQYRMIEAAVKKLDVVPVQVMIEATIAEVTLTDQLRYGLQFFFQKGNNSFSLSQLASGAVNAVFPGFNYVFASGNSRVVLDALSSITNVHVLSAPQLMVLDHQTATLQVGDQVPIAVQQARSTIDPNAPIVNSIELRNTGVILRVTPRVNSTGMSTLVVDQEVSDVARTTTSNIDSPTIQQRRISSVVAVGDGDTIALGGLIRENRTIGKDGLPVLSDIPVLGNLFSANSDTTNRTELLILLTPRVIKNRTDAQAVTEELRSRLSDIRLVP